MTVVCENVRQTIAVSKFQYEKEFYDVFYFVWRMTRIDFITDEGE